MHNRERPNPALKYRVCGLKKFISDLWADDGPSGYQPPSYEPVNPERRTPQTPSDGLI